MVWTRSLLPSLKHSSTTLLPTSEVVSRVVERRTATDISNRTFYAARQAHLLFHLTAVAQGKNMTALVAQPALALIDKDAECSLPRRESPENWCLPEYSRICGYVPLPGYRSGTYGWCCWRGVRWGSHGRCFGGGHRHGSFQRSSGGRHFPTKGFEGRNLLDHPVFSLLMLILIAVCCPIFLQEPSLSGNGYVRPLVVQACSYVLACFSDGLPGSGGRKRREGRSIPRSLKGVSNGTYSMNTSKAPAAARRGTIPKSRAAVKLI